jgi:hypothetical protein
MAFESILPKCPACNLQSLRTTQTVRTLVSVRRRKECDSCDYKFTTHEVQDDFFQQAKQNQALIQKLETFFNVKATATIPLEVIEEGENKCPTCFHNFKGKCMFSFPEYDTHDSFDCVNFSIKLSDCNDC